MFKGLFPGTFDPPTLGHLELISRAAACCDLLIVGIGENRAKGKRILTIEETVAVLKEETKSFSNVEIIPFSGLVTDFAKNQQAQVLIRGLRSLNDMDYELQMAGANRKLTGIETFFLMAESKTANISSSLIRELASLGAPLGDFIPSSLEEILHRRLKERK